MPRMFLLAGAVVCGLFGVALFAGGIWLAALRGSPYYFLAGAGMLACASLLFRARPQALAMYAVVLAGTTLWAVWEIGFDWWQLTARMDLPYLLGVWLLLPWTRRALGAAAGVWDRAAAPALAAALGLATVVLAVGLATDHHDVAGSVQASAAAASVAGGQPDEDWTDYGGTPAGDRYSPLTQITPDNARRLHVAWTFRTGDMPGRHDPVESTFEDTPIKVRGTLFICSPHQRLFALDAATGHLSWSYDPHVRDDPTFQHLTCRGVSYHEAPAGARDSQGAPAPTDCPHMVFLPVNDGRMVGLNADTGALCQHFGDHGTIDLESGMGDKTPGFYEPTSPPVVSDQILVVAGSVNDNYSTHEPSGVVRGFDIYTGRLVWAWDPGARDENALPSGGATYVNNSPNSWIASAYDPALGLVYVPMGVSTPDEWGGNRTAEEERYSSALVALDIHSGHRVWSYQTVHHDLWDMDLPSQPSLVDWPTAHGPVPAVIAPAKTGNLFVLDRRNGALLVPAPEEPVPQGAADGDHVSATQPFSALSFRPREKLSGADMWGATPLDQMACRIEFHRMRYEGPFTPPSLQGTVVFPGNLGMFEWGGVAVDPVRQVVIANPMSIPFVSRLVPRGPANPAAPTGHKPPGDERGIFPMYGTPYGVALHAFFSPLGLPCLHPPWGYMAAIDMRTGATVWLHRSGTIRDSAPVPLPFRMGVPMLGGPLTTAGGVAFLTATLDYYIRAYEVRTGALLWESRLPAGGQSTPMSYAVAGRQYVVTAAGGHGSLGTRQGDYVIAYALGD